MTRRWAAIAVAALLLAAGCGDDGGSGGPATSTEDAAAETTPSTAPPTFEGDPDSEFCRRSRDAADEPVLDPFEAGLEPREVELRFQALAQRFRSFADIAPAPLEDDLALLDETFADLADVLDDVDHDFGQLAEADVDVSVFDDPALADVAERLAAYQDQVCDVG